jgi:outer membrane protein OmpA-like peptidoglycan-associated protein
MFRRLIFIFIIIFTAANVFADKRSEANNLIKEAKEIIDDDSDYEMANELFDKAYDLDPNFSQKYKSVYAFSLYSENRIEDASKIYSEIPKNALSDIDNYCLGNIKILQGKHKEALSYFQKVTNKGGDLFQDAKLAMFKCKWVESNDITGKSKVKKLNSKIENGFKGVAFWDPTTLIVSSTSAGLYNLFKADLKSSKYSVQDFLEKKFAAPMVISAPTISSGEVRTLFFTMFKDADEGDNRLKYQMNLFSSEYDQDDEEWTTPKKFGYNSKDGIHSVCYPSISPDGTRLYFSSDIDNEGVGEFDLYLSVKDGDEWSEPEILPKVNSKKNEIFPFYDENSSRLYFSSNGFPGYGGYDLYYVELDEDGIPITDPVNLKKPLNSSSDDVGLTINPDDETNALLASNRDDITKDYIYNVKLANIPKDNAVARAVVPTSEGLEISPARKNVIIPNTIDNVKIEYPEFLITNSIDEYTSIGTLDLGEIQVVEKPVVIKPVEVKKQFKEVKVVPKKVYVPKPVKKVQKPVYKPVYRPKQLLARLFFRKKSMVLNSGAADVLKYIADYARTKSFSKITVIGYTDTFGSKESNEFLAWQRAVKVRNFLVFNYGLSINKIEPKGVGEQDYLNGLLSSLIDETVHAQNRRVDIYVE